MISNEIPVKKERVIFIIGVLILQFVSLQKGYSQRFESYLSIPSYPRIAATIQVTSPQIQSLTDILNVLNLSPPAQDYEFFKLDHESIYYINFSSIDTQNHAFNRLSFFVESNTYAGEILSDKELKIGIKSVSEGETLGIGHDYKIEDICRFYTKAKEKRISLNNLEKRIKEDLICLEIIEYEDNKYIPLKEIAIISSSPEVKNKYNFEVFKETLLHEYRHGIFFTDSFVQKELYNLWDTLSESQQEDIKKAISKLADYNLDDKDLLLNELYASLLDITSPLRIADKVTFIYLYDTFKKIEKLREDKKSAEIISPRIKKMVERLMRD